MACQCGCSTGVSRADVAQGTDGDCGCTTGSPQDLDVAALARVVKELDERVRQLELETSNH